MRYYRGHANTPAKHALTVLKKFNLGPGDRARLKRQPNGSCAICGEYSENLVYDHCHDGPPSRKNRPRDQICQSCNVRVGWAEKSQDQFEWAKLKSPDVYEYIVFWDKYFREHSW